MSQETFATRVWLLLLALTLCSALLTETTSAGILVGALVATIVSLKGRLVVRYYMGLDEAHPRLRRLMNGYFLAVPALILLLGFIA